MSDINIQRCPGPGVSPEATDWHCDGNVCKADGDWRQCKVAVERRGYKLIFTQDAKADARATGNNITDSYGHIYGR